MHMNRSYKSSRSEAAAVPVSQLWQLLIIIRAKNVSHTLSGKFLGTKWHTFKTLCRNRRRSVCSLSEPGGKARGRMASKTEQREKQTETGVSSHSSDCDREAWVRTHKTSPLCWEHRRRVWSRRYWGTVWSLWPRQNKNGNSRSLRFWNPLTSHSTRYSCSNNFLAQKEANQTNTEKTLKVKWLLVWHKPLPYLACRKMVWRRKVSTWQYPLWLTSEVSWEWTDWFSLRWEKCSSS